MKGTVQMAFRRAHLADLTYFLGIAKHRNFRRAALELGVSGSALSHTMKGLEERLGVRLLNRTSRSVTLTATREELRDAIVGPFDEIGRAVGVLNKFRDTPAGRIRLSVPTEAAELLVGPVLGIFVERYPDVEVEVSVSNRLIDVIDSGFDGGIRHTLILAALHPGRCRDVVLDADASVRIAARHDAARSVGPGMEGGLVAFPADDEGFRPHGSRDDA